jgi:hypothetical protein
LGSQIIQTLNYPLQPFYKLKDESNVLAFMLKEKKLSVLQEPIEVVFDEFYL